MNHSPSCWVQNCFNNALTFLNGELVSMAFLSGWAMFSYNWILIKPNSVIQTGSYMGQFVFKHNQHKNLNGYIPIVDKMYWQQPPRHSHCPPLMLSFTFQSPKFESSEGSCGRTSGQFALPGWKILFCFFQKCENGARSTSCSPQFKVFWALWAEGHDKHLHQLRNCCFKSKVG